MKQKYKYLKLIDKALLRLILDNAELEENENNLLKSYLLKEDLMELEDSIHILQSKSINLIATQIANGKLDSIAKVRALTEIFNSDFNLLSELLVK